MLATKLARSSESSHTQASNPTSAPVPLEVIDRVRWGPHLDGSSVTYLAVSDSYVLRLARHVADQVPAAVVVEAEAQLLEHGRAARQRGCGVDVRVEPVGRWAGPRENRTRSNA